MATKITTRVLADDAVTDAKIADVTLTTATQSASDNTTKIATTAYVTTAIANLADSAPSTLNTLNELAAALGDDANYATTTTNAIAAKLPLAGGTLTGDVTFNGTNLYFNGAASSAGHNLALENSDTFTSFFGSTSSSIDKGYKFFTGNQGGDLAFTINADKSIAIAGAATFNAGIKLSGLNGGTGLAFDMAGSGDYVIKESSTNDVMSFQGSLFHNFSNGAVLMGTTTQLNSAQLTVDNPNGQVGIALSETGTTVTALWGLDALNAIGTRTNHDFKIRSNDTDRITVGQGGNVGIGTTNPDTTLHINGTTNSEQVIITGGNTASRGLSISTVANNGQSNAGVIFNAQDTEHATYPALIYQTGGTERMRIDGSGNVGIGTAGAGSGKLHVDGHTSSVATILEGNGGGDTVPLNFRVKANNNNVTNHGIFGSAGSTGADNYLTMGPSSTNGVIIDNAGRVGIQTTTTNPGNAVLNINGGIRFNHFSGGHGLNCVSLQGFNNSSVANACGSVYYKMFILSIYHNNGHSQSLFLANGGGGVGFAFTTINSGDTTIRNGAVDFNLTTIGSQPNTFRIQVSYGGGALTVSRTSGIGSFNVAVHILAGG